MAAEVSVISLTTERQAVDVLRQILLGEIDTSNIHLDFREADWLQFKLKLKGEIYHQSLNSSAMRGLIEFQNSLFRSVSLLLHDSAKVTSLTDDEKSNFELIFRVSEGSSDVLADVKQSFVDLGTKLADKMSGKLICVTIISIAVGYFGVEGYKAHLGNTVDLKKVEADAQKNTLEKERQEDLTRLTEAVLKRSSETEKTLNDAAKAYDKVDRILEERNKAFEAIVKGAEKSDGIDLQGINIPNPVIEELNRSSRSRGRDVTLDTMFRVLAVDSSTRGSFIVRLMRISDNVIISAIIENSVRAERYHRALQKAEWKKVPVRVRVRARLFGDDDYRDAEIDSARAIRN